MTQRSGSLIAQAIRTTLLLLLAVAGTARSVECDEIPAHPDAAVVGAIDRILDAALADGFAGGVAMSKGGNLIYVRVAGFADRAGTIPVTPNTLFHVASMTKYITAILALKAVDEGAIALDSAIAPYVAGTDLAGQGYTFADLLGHRTGLGSSYAAESIRDAGGALHAIDAAGIDKSRVGTFRYSNDGYDLLGIILERIYDQPYEALVRQKLMAPACVTKFGFWGDTAITDPHRVSQPLTELPEALRGRNYGMLASAGLLITARDLVQFQNSLRRGLVLSPASSSELFAPRGEISIGSATFGGFLVDRPGLGRTISVRGYEDWGDNGYLTEYVDCGVTLAILTSRGPAEDSGKPAFRDSISDAIETRVLAGLCTSKAL